MFLRHLAAATLTVFLSSPFSSLAIAGTPVPATVPEGAALFDSYAIGGTGDVLGLTPIEERIRLSSIFMPDPAGNGIFPAEEDLLIAFDSPNKALPVVQFLLVIPAGCLVENADGQFEMVDPMNPQACGVMAYLQQEGMMVADYTEDLMTLNLMIQPPDPVHDWMLSADAHFQFSDLMTVPEVSPRVGGAAQTMVVIGDDMGVSFLQKTKFKQEQ